MSLKVGDLIEYNAGKASGRILAIRSTGKHLLFRISNGDELLDLNKLLGKPGGVKVLEGPSPIEKREPVASVEDVVGVGILDLTPRHIEETEVPVEDEAQEEEESDESESW